MYRRVSGDVTLADAGNSGSAARELTVCSGGGWSDTVLWNPYGNEARGSSGCSRSNGGGVVVMLAVVVEAVGEVIVVARVVESILLTTTTTTFRRLLRLLLPLRILSRLSRP